MNVLILGGSGMLGHKLCQVLGGRFDTSVTLRRPVKSGPLSRLLPEDRTITGVSAEDFESVAAACETARPDVVVNCIGVVKQLAAAKDPLVSITVNSLFPHQLANLCRERGCRLIHVSTDCVFSGRKGGYHDDDLTDAEDLYGRTKGLGEVSAPGCLTVRTSIIGREIGTAHGLIEWFLSQAGKTVKGYTKAVFSGLTTRALAETLAEVIDGHPELSGVRHVASEPINKHDLLRIVRDVYGLRVEIVPDGSVACDRSLNADRFRRETGLTPPPWRKMIEDMHADALSN